MPNPDPTRLIQVEENMPETNPVIWSDFPVQVSSVSGCISSGIGFIAGNNFWPGPASSGQNLAGSVEIWLKSGRIRRDLA